MFYFILVNLSFNSLFPFVPFSLSLFESKKIWRLVWHSVRRDVHLLTSMRGFLLQLKNMWNGTPCTGRDFCVCYFFQWTMLLTISFLACLTILTPCKEIKTFTMLLSSNTIINFLYLLLLRDSNYPPPLNDHYPTLKVTLYTAGYSASEFSNHQKVFFNAH